MKTTDYGDDTDIENKSDTALPLIRVHPRNPRLIQSRWGADGASPSKTRLAFPPMLNIVSNMNTVSIREVHHNLASLIEKVQRGQEITITKRGAAVAKLVPAQPKRKKKLQWPDFEARMKRIFPDGPPPGKPASEIIIEMREDRL